MLLREIGIGRLTILVDEVEGGFEIRVDDENGKKEFFHSYSNYEVVKATLDELTGRMETDSLEETQIFQILELSKDK